MSPKHLVATRSLVKQNASDYVRRHVEDVAVDTFSERLSWVVKPLSTGPGDDGGSEAARRLGLSRAAINSAIKSGSASFATLRSLRELTGVNLNWLVCGQERPGDVHWPANVTESVKQRTRKRRDSHAERRTVPPKRRA
jgi:hypothetical protein